MQSVPVPSPMNITCGWLGQLRLQMKVLTADEGLNAPAQKAWVALKVIGVTDAPVTVTLLVQPRGWKLYRYHNGCAIEGWTAEFLCHATPEEV